MVLIGVEQGRRDPFRLDPAGLEIAQVPSPNCWPGALTDVIGLVIHTMVGTLAGTDAEFGNPASQRSAHYGVGLDGSVHQYVALTDAAWANGSPNPGGRWTQTSDNANLHTISIETEDDGNPDGQPVTDDQYSAVLALGRLALDTWPSIQYLVAHEYINPAHSCPAARWLDSGRFAQLATDLGLTPLQ